MRLKHTEDWCLAGFLIALIIALIVSVTGCSTSKAVNTARQKSSIEKDSVTRSAAKVKETEESETITTLKGDSTVTLKGSTVQGSVMLQQLLEKPLVLEDHNQVVTVTLAQGKIAASGTVKDRTADIKIDKRVEERKKIDRNNTTENEAKVSQTRKSDEETKAKQVKRTGIPWWLWLLLIAAALTYYFLRKGIYR